MTTSVQKTWMVTHQAVIISHVGREEGEEERMQQQHRPLLCSLINFSHRNTSQMLTPALLEHPTAQSVSPLLNPHQHPIASTRSGGSRKLTEQPQVTGLSGGLALSQVLFLPFLRTPQAYRERYKTAVPPAV